MIRPPPSRAPRRRRRPTKSTSSATAASATVVALVLLASSSAPPAADLRSAEAFAPPPPPRPRPRAALTASLPRSPAPRPASSLSMGIRSFLRRKIDGIRKRGDGDGGDDDDAEEGVDAEPVTLHSILRSQSSAEGAPSEDAVDVASEGTSSGERKASRKKRGGRGGSSDTDKAQDSAYEDTQERIRRMKGGGMTEEEKLAFLNNALTIPKANPRGPPIRQKIPGMDDPDGGGTKGARYEPRKVGGGAKAGGGKPSADASVATLMMDGKMKDEEAKRRYMESITNPDRFATFSTYQSPPTAEAEGDASTALAAEEDASEAEADEAGTVEAGDAAAGVEDDASEPSTDFAEMKRQMALDRELLNPNKKDDEEKSAARDAVESILSMISSNNDKKRATSEDADDASSSEAAKSTDHLAERLGRAAEVQERRDAEARALAEARRFEEAEARAEERSRRDDELRRREVERMERAKRAAEEERRREEVAREAADKEQEEREAARDAYWAKKLEKEQERRAGEETADAKLGREVRARDAEEKREREVADDVVRDRTREEERAREDPREGEILGEAAAAKLRDRELVRDIEAFSAARVSRTVPQPSKEDASVSSFVREQRKKKEAIDRLRKVDERALKSLNSPIPSPGTMKRVVGLTPQIAPAASRAAPAPVVPPPPAPAPPPARLSSPDLSLASLTMAKKGGAGGEARTPAPPSPALSLAELTKRKPDSAVASPPSARKKPAKRVVRQQVPLSSRSIVGDDADNDEGDDDLMRSGAPGLTVADALRQQRKSGGGGASGGKKDLTADEKAKQWGIDISKFK